MVVLPSEDGVRSILGAPASRRRVPLVGAAQLAGETPALPGSKSRCMRKIERRFSMNHRGRARSPLRAGPGRARDEGASNQARGGQRTARPTFAAEADPRSDVAADKNVRAPAEDRWHLFHDFICL